MECLNCCKGLSRSNDRRVDHPYRKVANFVGSWAVSPNLLHVALCENIRKHYLSEFHLQFILLNRVIVGENQETGAYLLYLLLVLQHWVSGRVTLGKSQLTKLSFGKLSLGTRGGHGATFQVMGKLTR